MHMQTSATPPPPIMQARLHTTCTGCSTKHPIQKVVASASMSCHQHGTACGKQQGAPDLVKKQINHHNSNCAAHPTDQLCNAPYTHASALPLAETLSTLPLQVRPHLPWCV